MIESSITTAKTFAKEDIREALSIIDAESNIKPKRHVLAHYLINFFTCSKTKS